MKSFHRFERWLICLCACSALLTACRAKPTPIAPAVVTQDPLPAVSASPTLPLIPTNSPGETSTPSPTPQALDLPLPHYTISATLDYDRHHLAADLQVDYTNRTPDYLPDLRFMVEPLYYPGVFTLNRLSFVDGTAVENYTVETAQIRVPLQSPLAPGHSVRLNLSYELSLPSPTPSAELRPIPFGYTARQTNLVDWYPFIPPFVAGEGWLAHQAGFFGEHLVYELANFEVSLRISDDRPGLIVAASAPAKQDSEWRHYHHDAARSFAWSVSPEYQVFETSAGGVRVLSYAFPVHAAAAEAVLKTTSEALSLYSELYGNYQRPLLSVVEADFLDGMEYDGLYFLSNGFYNLYQGTPGEYLIAIAAHETAHQWFYARVGSDQAIEPWLDEALCTYQERIYYENKSPESLDWWWAYRVNYYNPGGGVDGSIYNPQGYRAYRDAVYLNGALFLEELRKRIGDGDFFAFLKDYVEKNSGQVATGDRFFEILAGHTQEDLSDLISIYFEDR